jgi:hypothetical protein
LVYPTALGTGGDTSSILASMLKVVHGFKADDGSILGATVDVSKEETNYTAHLVAMVESINWLTDLEQMAIEETSQVLWHRKLVEVKVKRASSEGRNLDVDLHR